MVLKLRLSRPKAPGGSKKHHPRYNIVLAHARTARDSRPLEVLGTYNPIPELPAETPSGGSDITQARPSGSRKVKDIKVDVSRTKYWLGVGAQPSETVWRLLSMIGLLEPKYLPHGPNAGAQTSSPRGLKAVRFPTHVKPKPTATSIADQAQKAWGRSQYQGAKEARAAREARKA